MSADAVTAFHFDNSFARDMPGFYAAVQAQPAPAPRLLRLNEALANELGAARLTALPPGQLAACFSGNVLPAGAEPIAQAYAGHQFGGFSPSLGDGRALLLGEVIDQNGQRRDIALKGSGRTVFSRNGDGKAALGPMLREYLIGEAMQGLGIPTTRALAVVATGEPVRRERMLPGAVLTRVAASHLRIGTFQYFAARGEHAQLRRLADYAIARHDPDLLDRSDRYLAWLSAVSERQARLLAQWMLAGFIHGVMNTDNAAISGESIDFGPCAFMEAFDPRAVFSSIDSGGRYAYANQPRAAQWNLARLGETVLALMDEATPEANLEAANEVIVRFMARYEHHWLEGMRAKLGLDASPEADQAADLALARDWLELLHLARADYTLSFRALADAAEGDEQGLRRLLGEHAGFEAWYSRWQERAASSVLAPAPRAQAMRRVNPLYIARNHRVEEALAAAEQGDMAPFERLLIVLAAPFERHGGFEDLAEPAPLGFSEGYQTFCGT